MVGDMLVKMATEGSDINRKTSPDCMSKGEQFIVIESDSDIEMCETIPATQSIPPTSCLELAYMKGNGDISPDISETNTVPENTLKDDLILNSEYSTLQGYGNISPDISESNAVPECTFKDDLLLDSEDASSIAALIFVMDKFVEWSQVISQMDEHCIQSDRFTQFADITKSLGNKFIMNRNKLRLLGDKIFNKIKKISYLHPNDECAHNTDSSCITVPAHHPDQRPIKAPVEISPSAQNMDHSLSLDSRAVTDLSNSRDDPDYI